MVDRITGKKTAVALNAIGNFLLFDFKLFYLTISLIYITVFQACAVPLFGY
jgi:hypothetical protein